MITERPTPENDPCRFGQDPHDARDRRCGRPIVLDGVIYYCARFARHGIHDARATHSDGGLVRW